MITNFKTKLAKKAISLLLLVAMILTLSANIGFSAFATEQQEIDFCVDKMKNLPTDSEFLEEMLKLPSENGLKELREETVVHSDSTTEKVDVYEKKCYQEIQDLVQSLTKDFKDQKGGKFAANMQKADAIYRWVAENIHYDHESADANRGNEKTSAKRKPQDAYFVFAKKTGVCEGYARLLNLMMRMAGVPCMCVSSIKGSDKDNFHVFNAVYVEEESDDRKGWTLLDSCWASPNSDGDEGVTMFLSGKVCFCDINLVNALATGENEYAKTLYEKFKAFEGYQENPDLKLIDDFNKKSPEILKELNEQYKDSAHFETIKFSDENGFLYVEYKTDLTMEQAKQAQDQRKKRFINSVIKDLVDNLTGKSKIYCTSLTSNTTSDNLKQDDFKMGKHFFSVSNGLEKVNDNDEKVQKYCDELEKIYVDIVFPNLKDIEGNMDEINLKLNDKLKELNKQYAGITKIKKVQLSVEKEGEGSSIVGNFEADISSEDIQTKARKYLNEEPNKRKKENFAKYFPAFYKTDQSLEESNRRIICYGFHKISQFEVDSVEGSFKINLVHLVGHEAKADLCVGGYGAFGVETIELENFEKMLKSIKKVIISDDGVKLDDNICCRCNLPDFGKIVASNIENLALKGNVVCDISIVKNAVIGDNVSAVYIYNVENLTIKGDATINLDEAYELKNIDTTKSNKYHAENGILYEKVDGKKGKEIGEIFKECVGEG